MKRGSFKHGDILMTKTGRINTENSSLGRAALYMGEDDAANVNGYVYFIKYGDIYFLWLNSNKWVYWLWDTTFLTIMISKNS